METTEQEVFRLRARVTELEAELKEIQDELCPPGSFDHFFKEPPRNRRKPVSELSADDYKEQILKPLGYKLAEGI